MRARNRFAELRSRTARSGATRLLSAAVVVVAMVASACNGGGADNDSSSGDEADETSAPTLFSDRGPYASGVTTLGLPDRDVEVWYPADPADVEGADEEVFYIRDNAWMWAATRPTQRCCATSWT